MKTPPISIVAKVLLSLALGLNSHPALGQVGVWVARDSSRWWSELAASADGTKLVATCASENKLFTSSDSGATWTLRNSSHSWNPVASSTEGTKLLAPANGLVYLSTDSGLTWNTPAGGPNRGWTGAASSADGTRLVALGGEIWTSTDSGSTWAAHSFGDGSHQAYAVAASADGTKLVIGTYNDRLYTSTNSGATWTARESSRDWGGVASSADGTRLAAVDQNYGGVGYLYTSTDSGVTWTARGALTNRSCVASSADGTRLVTAGKGPIFISTDGGVSWQASSASNNWVAVASSADGNKLVAAAYPGQIYTYTVPVTNDLCPGALALSSGVAYSMDTTYATSTNDPTPACQANFGNGVWFKHTAAGNGNLLISTCGSGFDTVLQVFTGTCGGLTPIGCNDDYGPACSGSRQSSLVIPATAGITYYILAGGYNSATGQLQIVVQLPNDSCAGAVALTNGVTYSMSTAGATSLNDPSPGCVFNFGKGVWFTFTPAASRVVKIDTCGSDFDTGLQVYSGNCGSLVGVAGACNDDSNVCGSGTQSSVAFAAAAGTTYYILAGGYNGTSGNLSLTASEAPLAITQQPVGGTANSGDSFTFNVTATGTNLAYQWQWGGANYYGATSPSFTVSDLEPTMAGNYRVVITNVFGAVTSSVAALSVDPALALALDTAGQAWTTGGDNGAWYRGTLFSHDGVDAARCIGSSGSPPWLQTSFTGPGTVSFYWGFVVDFFDTTSDYLGLLVDGVEVAKRNASHINLQFYPQTIYLGSGTHTLRWVYDRNGGATGAAYLDQVGHASGATPAFIATQPTPQTTLAGSNATFTVGASGTPPFTYQWQFNQASLANATNSSLTLTNVQPVQGSNYSVVVANGYGSPVTSSIVALTVTTVPLPVALDYAGPAWRTAGHAAWFGEVGPTHDGADAAQSGWLTNNQQGTLTANLIGPGTLSFWWKVSSETNFDFLRFYTNSVYRTNISGEVGWQQQTINLPAGAHAVTWAYSKDGSLSSGQDAGWVDQVTYDGPPYLSVAPLAQNKLLLWWPHSVTGCLLQKTTNLVAPVNWQNVPDPAYWAGDNWVVTNISSEPVRFYRLKK